MYRLLRHGGMWRSCDLRTASATTRATCRIVSSHATAACGSAASTVLYAFVALATSNSAANSRSTVYLFTAPSAAAADDTTSICNPHTDDALVFTFAWGTESNPSSADEQLGLFFHSTHTAAAAAWWNAKEGTPNSWGPNLCDAHRFREIPQMKEGLDGDMSPLDLSLIANCLQL
ncbi:hypothetical protein OPV22_024665 [Ensete ventricosum]|uniref:Uncharacterized protein n=1 Tax=Ensete ventricosum TaxID=4639 RepID=A0AAV8QDI6_ENSVE|nr:hypothetical protein OPV22_024665 [Ensete ventricosum]